MRSKALAAVLFVAALPLPLAAQPSAVSAFDSLEPPTRARVTCSIQAATRFSLPANLVIAVAEQEGGRSGQWVQNTNGSYDVGPLQFNTAYLQTLARYGITAKDVEVGGCYPYELAAWRIRGHLDRDAGDIWTRAANYHSRTRAHNTRYRTAIRARAAKWGRWLSEHVPSVEIAPLEAPPAPNPPPVPPPRSPTEDVTATATQRASRRSTHRSKPAPLQRTQAEPVSAPHPDSAPREQVVETLAAMDARRRCHLLALVSAQPCYATTQASLALEAQGKPEPEHVRPTSRRTARIMRRVAAASASGEL